MAPRFVITVNPQEIRQGFAGLFQPIKTAAEKAIEDVEGTFKAEARANMAAAGFGVRFQNATRTRSYTGAAARNAIGAVFLWSKIPWAGVHEEGATISGKPMLYLPLRNVPKYIGRRRMSVENYRIAGLPPLFPIKSSGGKPLLAAKVRLSKRKAEARSVVISMGELRRGTGPRSGGVIRTVPLFVGLRQVTIRKRLDIAGVAESIRDQLPELYYKHFSD